MTYEFKLREELVWAILVVVLPALLQVLVAFDLQAFLENPDWGRTLLQGVVRAVGGGLLAAWTLLRERKGT